MTLIVVTETPIAWHDTEAFLADAKVRHPVLIIVSREI